MILILCHVNLNVRLMIMDELKNATEYDSEKHNKIIFDDLNKNQLNDNKVQMLFKRGRHNNISVFVISHGF